MLEKFVPEEMQKKIGYADKRRMAYPISMRQRRIARRLKPYIRERHSVRQNYESELLFSISSKSLICGEIFSSSFIYIFPSVWIKTKSCSFFPSFKRGTHKETAPPPDMMMAARDMMPLESLTPVATVTTAETIIIIISKVAAQFLTQYEMLCARLSAFSRASLRSFPMEDLTVAC